MENTKISWADHTFNPWHGCTKIGPGCANCYAECTAERWGHDGIWGDDADRRFLTGKAHWAGPLRWNRKAEGAGKPALVFCGSMCDWLEIHPKPEIAERQNAVRGQLFGLIDQTPWLIWLLLSKRLENWSKCVPEGWLWGKIPRNVWVGATVVNQAGLEVTYPLVHDVEEMYHPAMTFLSLEPLLEPLDLVGDLYQICTTGWGPGPDDWGYDVEPRDSPIWLIVGGESRQRDRCRLMEQAWLESVIAYGEEFCQPVFVKQLGHLLAEELGCTGKGADPAEWPENLRVQQFPFELVRYQCPERVVGSGACSHPESEDKVCHCWTCPRVKELGGVYR